MRRALLLSSMLLLAACDGSDDRDAGAGMDAGADAGSGADAGARADAGAGADAGAAADAGAGADGGAGTDGGAGFDAGGSMDAGPGRDAGYDAGFDSGVPARSDHHIHIDVSNTCAMTVSPTSITIPAGQTAYFDWHNHSRDYPVTVWMSYGGGFTDLPQGATWDEPIGHCIGPRAHVEYADISTACSSFRFNINCL